MIAATLEVVLSLTDKASAGLKSATGVLKTHRMELIAVSGALTAIGYAAVRVGSQMDEAMRNLGRTTGDTVAGLSELRNEIFDIAVRTGYSSKEIAGMANSVAGLGIRGQENIALMTEAVAPISKETGVASSTVAESMGRISNAFGLPLDEIINLGSALDALDDTSVATSEDILEFTRRLAPVASSMGMTADEVMALGTTFTELGINTRAAMEMGGIIAKAGGFDALIAYTEKLKSLGTEQERVVAITKDFGAGAVDVLLPLSAHLDTLKTKMALANAEFTSGTRISSDMSTSLNTLNESFSKMLDIIYGKLSHAIEKLAGFMNNLAEAVERLDPSTVSLAVGLGAVVAGVTALGAALPTITSGLGFFVKLLGAANSALFYIGIPLGLVVAATWELGAAWGLVFNNVIKPILAWLGRRVLDVANVLNDLKIISDDTLSSLVIHLGDFENKMQEYGQNVKDTFTFEGLKDVVGGLVEDLKSKFTGFFDDVSAKSTKAGENIGANLTAGIDSAINSAAASLQSEVIKYAAFKGNKVLAGEMQSAGTFVGGAFYRKPRGWEREMYVQERERLAGAEELTPAQEKRLEELNIFIDGVKIRNDEIRREAKR